MSRKLVSLSQSITALSVFVLTTLITLPVLSQSTDYKSRAMMRDASHLLKIGNAMELYLGDNDQNFPLHRQQYANGVCAPFAPSICGLHSRWYFHIYPYLNDWRSLYRPDRLAPQPQIDTLSRISYGYNYSYLNEVCVVGSKSFVIQGCNSPDPGNPNGTTWYLSRSFHLSSNPSGLIVAMDSFGDFAHYYQSGSAVSPPDSGTFNRATFESPWDGWGMDCYPHYDSANIELKPNYADHEFFDPRFSGKGNVLFGDGHVELLAPEEVAAGTNYHPGAPCTDIRMTDPSRYLWDLN